MDVANFWIKWALELGFTPYPPTRTYTQATTAGLLTHRGLANLFDTEAYHYSDQMASDSYTIIHPDRAPEIRPRTEAQAARFLTSLGVNTQEMRMTDPPRYRAYIRSVLALNAINFQFGHNEETINAIIHCTTKRMVQ